jgi:hypothetical protein
MSSQHQKSGLDNNEDKVGKLGAVVRTALMRTGLTSEAANQVRGVLHGHLQVHPSTPQDNGCS